MAWTSPHNRPLPAPEARTLLMGIVNVTPDSFSDGGKFFDVENAVTHARQLVADGADLLDLGAESTRPGHAPLDAETEIARLLPVLRAVRAALPAVPISVDTNKAEVAEASIQAGADIINDVFGGKNTAGIAGKLNTPLILMHNRPAPFADDSGDDSGKNFWDDFLSSLKNSVAHARAAGVPATQLWLDPGFGFGKTPAQNLSVLRYLDRVCALGPPVLLGISRKSTLGLVLDEPVPERRAAGNIAGAVWGLARGAAMVRVHDISEVRQAVKFADAVRFGFRLNSK